MSDNWLDEFADPPVAYRPVPFWSWNERMEPDEVRRQVDQIAAAGWGGAFLHSRVGLTTPYLGQEWFAACAAAIDQCRRRGLKVFLYDEDKWPSGYSGGTVPLANKAFRMKALIARRVGAPVVEGALPLGPPVAGLQVYCYVAPLGNPWYNGTSYSDTMSHEAMARFRHDAYQVYYDRYAADYGQTIVAEFTDEPNALFQRSLPSGPVPFSSDLLLRFEEMHGYDPLPRLYLLFVADPAAPRFRLHYYLTINDLFENNYSRQLGEWCDRHGLALTGHYMAEGHLYEQQRWGVKLMGNYRYQGIPGIDLLGRQVNERIGAKMCHSVVNQYGKPRMLSELYGCSGGGLSFADRAWIAGMQMALGVTLLNPHLSLYTMTGCRKRDYPQNIYYQQPWWPLNRICDDPLSRQCVALSQGRYHAEVLVIHPQESVLALWQARVPKGQTDPILPWEDELTAPGVREQVNEIDSQLKAVTEALLGAQRTYDFADETILREAGQVVTSGDLPHLRVGQMDYPAVVLPAMRTMAPRTLELLREFAAAGGTVLRCGRAPEWVDGEPSGELAAWLKSVPAVEVAELPEALATAVPPAVKVSGPTAEQRSLLLTHTRDLADGARLVYLVNLHREQAFTGKMHCAGPWRSARLLDARTGRQEALAVEVDDQGLTVPVAFAEGQSHLLLLSTETTTGARGSLLPAPVFETKSVPPEAWQVERLDDNALTLDYALWRESDGGWSTRPMPVIAIQQRLNEIKYYGPLTLRYPVQVKGLSPDRKLHLVVEYPERYRLSVNGQEVRYEGLPFYRDFRWLPSDVTGLLHDGENIIELHCPEFIYGDLTSYEDAFRRYGTEIEAIYLVGDFAVAAEPTEEKPLQFVWQDYHLPPPGVQCFREGTICLEKPGALCYGDTTRQGLPFYAGRLGLMTELPDSQLAEGERLLLELTQLDCPVAEVKVDGETVGYFTAHPLQVDLTEAVRAGGRRLELILYGTLRNLLGPHHNKDGELAAVGPPSFVPSPDGGGAAAEWTLRWLRGEVSPSNWRDRYCMVTFGDLGEIRLMKASVPRSVD